MSVVDRGSPYPDLRGADPIHEYGPETPDPSGETLAECFYFDTEPGILAATSALLANIEDRVTDTCKPSDEIKDELVAARSTVAGLASKVVNSEPDPTEAFRADPASAYAQARAALLGCLDRCTTAWRSSNQTPFLPQSVQGARESAIAMLLGYMGETFGLAHTDIIVGETTADTRSMRIAGQVPTNNPRLVGKVAGVPRAGFTLNDGTLWRPADVFVFVDELEYASALLAQNPAYSKHK